MKKYLWALLPALLAQRGVPEEQKPNIVFIITDDQSWDTIQCLGGQVLTPTLDQLRADGIYLSNFHATSTVCSPSRYSFLTGRYAGGCRADHFMRLHPDGQMTRVENNAELEKDRWHLARVLQKHGYTTGFVGKSHVINHNWADRPYDWESFGLKPYPRDADPRDPEINARMQHNHRMWCEAIKEYGFDYADGIYAANLLELWNEKLNVHNLEWTVSKALDFLDQYHDQPFFLYFSTTLHHGPDPGNPRFALKADPRMTGEGFVAEGFDVMPSRESVLERNAQAGLPENVAHALWLDDGVAAILNKLNELGLDENTVVFFVPDQGIYRHAKSTLHDYGMKVPMFVRWTGRIPANTTYDRLVANIDFAPTVMDLLGIPPPEDYEIDGRSFHAALFGCPEPIREYLFGEMGYSRAVKTESWKYIAVRYPEEVEWQIAAGQAFPNYANHPPPEVPYLTRNTHLGFYSARHNPNYFDRDQLYHLTDDPAENKNVFDQYPEVGRRMQQALTRKLAKFPDRPFAEFTGERIAPPPALDHPDAYGTPLMSVTDSQVAEVTVDGRAAWQVQRREGRPGYFYFKIDDPLFREGAQPDVAVRVTYLDRGNTDGLVQYDSSDPHGSPDSRLPPGAFKHLDRFPVLDSGAWRTNLFVIRDAWFGGRCHGADLRISFQSPDADSVISEVAVYRLDPKD